MGLIRHLILPLALTFAGAASAGAEPAVPDYADPAYWTAITALPEGASAVPSAPKVDVFWIHPTTTASKTGFNHDPLDPAGAKWTDESAVQRQASAFSGCCRIFAPRYRAATSKALYDPAMRDKAFALAFSDIERAFDWYLAHENKGRPFILAGHSQGAAHVASLLEKRIDGTPLQGRMVAAYVIGINLAEGEFGLRFKHLSPCRQPAQTGCVLQWNAVLAGSNLDHIVSAYEKTFTDKYGDAPGRTPLCINPVTFDADKPSALSAEAKGAAPGAPGLGAMKPLRAGAVAVKCERGMAVSYLAPGLDLKPLPGGSMHYHDVGLFWGDVRANALRRSRAWLRARGKAHK